MIYILTAIVIYILLWRFVIYLHKKPVEKPRIDFDIREWGDID